VIETYVGYTGGSSQVNTPNYRSIGDHTETLQLKFDPSQISYENLLTIFWNEHSATYESYSLQYKSAIYCHTREQKLIAKNMKTSLEKISGKPIYTVIEDAKDFYLAEDYHQKFAFQGCTVISGAFKYDTAESIAHSPIFPKLNGYLTGRGKREDLLTDLKRWNLSPLLEEQIKDIHNSKNRSYH